MTIKINCKYNDDAAWCKHKEIKRSLWGFGARLCVLYPPKNISECEYQEYKIKKSRIAPRPIKKLIK